MSKYTPKTPRRQKSNTSTSSDSEQRKDPVSVYCRLRSPKDENQPCCVKLISPTVLSLSCPTESKILRKEAQYAFKHIFTSYATQKEIFEHVAFPLLGDLLRGRNGLLFTYGVTGSGKTYTLTGDAYDPGIMPRCIDTIFNTISSFQAQKYVIKSDRMNGFEVQSENDAVEDRLLEHKVSKTGSLKRKESKPNFFNDGLKILGVSETNLYAVFISYVEIYNNIVYDLLDESGGKTLQSKILREDSQKNMYVNGVIEMEVKSSSDAFELFNLGQKRKRMGHTSLNAESSRSHSIFNIRVVQLVQEAHDSLGNRVIPDGNHLLVGQLSLVDLAGSERTNRTQNTGMRLKEASAINNSLMSLRSCLEILRDNQMNNANRLVPYRDSRLTLLFKNYFEGDGKVSMIVCVNPASVDYEENLQVMKFAELTQDVKVIKPESRYTPYRKINRMATPGPKVKSSSTMGHIFPVPKIGNISMNFDDLDSLLVSINNHAKLIMKRRQKGVIFHQEVEVKESKFRKRLMQMNQDCTLQQTELRSAQQQFRKERKRNQNLEVKTLEMERQNLALENKNDELMNVVRSLKGTLNEKDMKLNQNLLERERQKQKMAIKQERLNQETDEKLRRQREHYNTKLMADEHKLRRVREILEKDPLTLYMTPPDKSSEEQEAQTDPKPIITPRSVQTQVSKMVSTPRRNFAVANRRRSRSVGETWLEHNSVKPVPLGTIMQPSMRRRKSVTKLSKASDVTNSKQSKYCLIAQEADTDGEVETKVYKGDIVPTCGGGAQVIFNDVERLRQESPVSTPHK